MVGMEEDSWAPPGEQRKIETTAYKVVLDEASSKPTPEQFELTLEVFHFLQHCPQHQKVIPTPGMLELALGPPRHMIVESLMCHREVL
ncbi:hypothetical protein FS749_015516 [Ceratobasidium sp. UAMH 11750]|nr:hypothetical protein FS749_015516 [Ceratobasidium sp. UAMH 11750]